MRACTRDARRRTIHRAAAGAVAALVAIAAPVAAASTASAHSGLVSSDPVPGSTLASSPAQITLTFNEDVLEMGAAVFVVDASGVDHAGEPVVDGTTVTVPVEGSPTGALEARWRVVSGDGHPISDVLPFTVAGGAAAGGAPDAAAAGSSQDGTAATDEASGADASPDDASADDASTGDASAGAAEGQAASVDAPGVPRTLLVGIAGAAVALVVLALVLGIRRSRARTAG